jgi:CheY-like chemotaxis protein
MENELHALVVDDHPATVALIRSSLEQLGLTVASSQNGAECLLAIQQNRPDLILLDVNMPLMDGFQTLHILQQNPETRAIPIIMLTARSDDTDIALGWRWGVTSYLTKPFAVEHLVALVRRVLAGIAAESVEELSIT